MWGAQGLAGAIKSDGNLWASGSVDRLSRHNSLLSFTAIARAAAVQREEPVIACKATHRMRHQADVRSGHQRRRPGVS
jgi:hypothetical protein